MTEQNPTVAQAVTIGELMRVVRERAFNSQDLVTGAPTSKPRKLRSATTYEQHITRVVKDWPDLPGLEPTEVTEEAVFFHASRFKQKYCPETYNGALMIMRAVFALAIRRGLIKTDPSADLPQAKIPTREWNLPRPPQWAAAVEAVRKRAASSHRPRLLLSLQFVEWCASTGMRPTASYQLQILDVDFDKETVRLSGEFAKNGRTVYLPLTQTAVRVAREAAGNRPVTERLFRCRHPKHALRIISQVCKIHVNLASLRKLFATTAIEAGVPVAITARLLTHSDGGQLLLKHYVQWRDDALRAAVRKMDAPGTA